MDQGHQRREHTPRLSVDALLVSTFVVAIAEIGDKTQLLSIFLAARFRKPVPIIAGILLATLANHAAAAALGQWVRAVLPADTLRWLLGLSFLAVAAWALKPDRLEQEQSGRGSRLGVFVLTFIAFLLAEIGDKTQVATVMLAARYPSMVAVVLGTTLGMMLVNVQAVLLGQVATQRIPLTAIRLLAAGLFAAIGIAVLAGLG